jgi:thymine-DNA glycosylase
LHESGVTPIRHPPSDTHRLPDLYNIGNTNICARATRDGSGLFKEELAEGAQILEDKIRKYKPEAVAIVGKGIWEALWLARTGRKLKSKEFKYGWQDEEAWLGKGDRGDGDEEWKGSRVFVTTTTSGLAAGMKPQEKLDIWRPLGEWFSTRREEVEKEKADAASS